jgi:hypothetical protein
MKLSSNLLNINPTINAWATALLNIKGADASLAGLIDSYSLFPLQFLQSNEPETDEQRELIRLVRKRYICVAAWLSFYLESRHELYPKLATYYPEYQPIADLSMARLVFCRQIWIAMPLAQEIADNYEILWFLCELSDCLYSLRGSGFWGNLELNEQGKTWGKKAAYSRMQAVYGGSLKSIEWNGDLSDLKLRPAVIRDYIEHLTDLLCCYAVENDRSLQKHCKRWLQAQLEYQQICKDSEKYQIFHIRDNSIVSTTKGRKSWKPKSTRGRGRPPKGSK